MTKFDGTVVWAADYKPFGEAQIDQTVTTITNNLRFPGQYFDAETGTHYNYFRDYNPAIGRYKQADPIGLKGGINPYVYVANKPLKYIDSLGLRIVYSNGSQVRLNPYMDGIAQSDMGRQVLAALNDPSNTYYLHAADGSNAAETRGNRLRIDLDYTPVIDTSEGRQQTTTVRMLAHELGHLLKPNASEDYITNTYENGIMTSLDGMRRNYIPTSYCH